MKKALLSLLLPIFLLGSMPSLTAASSSQAPAPHINQETAAPAPKMNKRSERKFNRALRILKKIDEKVDRFLAKRPNREKDLDEGLKKALLWGAIAIGLSILSTVVSILGLGLVSYLFWILSVGAWVYAVVLLIKYLVNEV